MEPYTKEPWYSQWADNGNLRIVEQSDEAAIIADVNVERQEITGRPEEEGIANGRRIVACVNACKDISDPETEIAQLRQDKHDLLEATGRALWVLQELPTVTFLSTAIASLEAAIKKATQQDGWSETSARIADQEKENSPSNLTSLKSV